MSTTAAASKSAPAPPVPRPPKRPGVVATARAFGVVFGPSVTLQLAGVASAAATLGALGAGRRPSRRAVVGAALTGLYVGAVRPWMLRWGATDEEARRPMPGDELVPESSGQVTRAITVDAPIERVWSWLAQIGQDRGGFYSYEWLETPAGCQMQSAGGVHPEWRPREVGEPVFMPPATGLPVARFEPPRVFALRGWGTFVLEPLD